MSDDTRREADDALATAVLEAVTHAAQEQDAIDVQMAYGSPELSVNYDAIAEAVRSAAEPIIRRHVAEEIRRVAIEQDSWLWFEVGESALRKVAAYVEPRDADIARQVGGEQ